MQFGMIDWREEAIAVIDDISKHVHSISISEQLDVTKNEIYLNCETNESNKYTIRLSSAGYQMVGNAFDLCTNKAAIAYETPYALLGVISPGYITSFGNELSRALSQLAQDSI